MPQCNNCDHHFTPECYEFGNCQTCGHPVTPEQEPEVDDNIFDHTDELPQTVTQPDVAMMFSNGNMCFFDKDGQQIGELQNKGWIILVYEHLETFGIDPTKINIRMVVNGTKKTARPFKTPDGEWNTRFENVTD